MDHHTDDMQAAEHLLQDALRRLLVRNMVLRLMRTLGGSADWEQIVFFFFTRFSLRLLGLVCQKKIDNFFNENLYNDSFNNFFLRIDLFFLCLRILTVLVCLFEIWSYA